MFGMLEISKLAQGLAVHAAARQSMIAQNVANADTPGYKARDTTPFAALVDGGGTMRSTRPGHLSASGQVLETALQAGEAAPNGNSVSLESEMVKAVEVRQQHDLALAISRTAGGILRTSLGRGR